MEMPAMATRGPQGPPRLHVTCVRKTEKEGEGKKRRGKAVDRLPKGLRLAAGWCKHRLQLHSHETWVIASASRDSFLKSPIIVKPAWVCRFYLTEADTPITNFTVVGIVLKKIL